MYLKNYKLVQIKDVFYLAYQSNHYVVDFLILF